LRKSVQAKVIEDKSRDIEFNTVHNAVSVGNVKDEVSMAGVPSETGLGNIVIKMKASKPQHSICILLFDFQCQLKVLFGCLYQ
jgi:hypothetical protein